MRVRRARARRTGLPVEVDGVLYTAEDCGRERARCLRDYFTELSRVMADCDRYTSRLLDSDVFGAHRRIYREGRHGIPTLKERRLDGSLRVIASDATRKADIFNKKFFDNTCLPADFPFDALSDRNVTSQVNLDLDCYQFADDGNLVEVAPSGGLIVTPELFSTIETVSDPGSLGVEDFCYDSLSCCDDYFHLGEVRSARFSLKKGIGSAGFNNDHVRKLKGYGIDFILLFVFNLFFHCSYWPRLWRDATIFPLIKGGVRDSWNAGDYRGISILDTASKLLEKLIYLRLTHICSPFLTETQSGGLARNGSIHQLIRVVECVNSAMTATDFNSDGTESCSRYVCLALLDCSKAFDRMFRPRLLAKLRAMGVSGRLFCFWSFCFLTVCL